MVAYLENVHELQIQCDHSNITARLRILKVDYIMKKITQNKKKQIDTTEFWTDLFIVQPEDYKNNKTISARTLLPGLSGCKLIL